ncbi:hypothetical protein HYU10_04840 [Candidatus Woesearchaeota archaeon]|nr:hypothetical protein [Candidatus Woesearchaeota archaeon]
MPKAQVQTAIVYLFAGTVMTLVLVLGYNYFSTFRQEQEKVSSVQLQQELRSDIESIRADYGSWKELSYRVPEGVAKVCFSEIKPVDTATCSGCQADTAYPAELALMQDDQNQNMFLLGRTNAVKGSAKMGKLSTGCCAFVCVAAEGNSVKLRLEGTGDKAVVKTA